MCVCDRSNVKYELQLQLQRLQVLHRSHDDDNDDDDDLFTSGAIQRMEPVGC